MAGDNSCEWATWFRAHYERGSYDTIPSTFDLATWQVQHTDMIRGQRDQLEREGKTVYVESQNLFRLKGTVATVGGKPDLIAEDIDTVTVVDVKTGQPRESDEVQAMIYMYAVPLALPRYRGKPIGGAILCHGREVTIPPDAVTEGFRSSLVDLVHRLSSETPAVKVPSAVECNYCEITTTECPERVEDDRSAEGETLDF
jgi:RecB family exonuclease